MLAPSDEKWLCLTNGLIRPFPYLTYRTEASRYLPSQDSLGSLSSICAVLVPFHSGTGVALSVPRGGVDDSGDGVCFFCSSMNDNFRELLGVVAALVLYLGTLWFLLLR